MWVAAGCTEYLECQSSFEIISPVKTVSARLEEWRQQYSGKPIFMVILEAEYWSAHYVRCRCRHV